RAATPRKYPRASCGARPNKLNAGLPSDRIYVEWPIGHDRTYKRLKGEDRSPAPRDAEREAIHSLLNAEEGDRPGPVNAGPVDESHLLIAIPGQFQSLKARDAALALEWRLRPRGGVEGAFAKGYGA